MWGCITISLCWKLRELLHRLIAPRIARIKQVYSVTRQTIHICFNDAALTQTHMHIDTFKDISFPRGIAAKRNFYDESKTKRSINHVRAILPLFGIVPESRKVCNKLSRSPSHRTKAKKKQKRNDTCYKCNALSILWKKNKEKMNFFSIFKKMTSILIHILLCFFQLDLCVIGIGIYINKLS